MSFELLILPSRNRENGGEKISGVKEIGLKATAFKPIWKLGGGAEEIRTLDPHVANVVL